MKATSVKELFRAEWDRALACLLIGAGAALVLICWIGVSDTPFVADQLLYIASGGIGGLFLLALGLALLMSADHHDEWRKLDAIEAALREPCPPATTPAVPATVPVAAPPPLRERSAVAAQSTVSRSAEGRVRGLSMLSVGGTVSAVIMAVGWAHSSGDGRQAVAAEGLTLSIAGLLVAVAAVAAFLMPSRSRLAARRALLLRGFTVAPAGGPSTNGSGDVVLVAGGLSRYHRPGCPAVNGVAATPTSRSAVGSDLKPCDLCATGEQ